VKKELLAQREQLNNAEDSIDDLHSALLESTEKYNQLKEKNAVLRCTMKLVVAKVGVPDEEEPQDEFEPGNQEPETQEAPDDQEAPPENPPKSFLKRFFG
jgi:hypothetical protein